MPVNVVPADPSNPSSASELRLLKVLFAGMARWSDGCDDDDDDDACVVAIFNEVGFGLDPVEVGLADEEEDGRAGNCNLGMPTFFGFRAGMMLGLVSPSSGISPSPFFGSTILNTAVGSRRTRLQLDEQDSVLSSWLMTVSRCKGSRRWIGAAPTESYSCHHSEL